MAEEVKVEGKALEKPIATQEELDKVIGYRINEIKQKYSDYDNLVKFKTEHEKQLDAAKTKELEAQKEYDKLKEGWTKKEQEYAGKLSQKDLEIKDMKITTALSSEINKQNAYAEETIALIKSQAVVDETGNIRIKGRDANGVEVLHSVEEGIKNFLTQRPHLVKVAKKDGGGTGAGGTGNAGAGAGVQDLNTLNAELLAAQSRGDHKKIGELTTKIKAALAQQGIRR